MILALKLAKDKYEQVTATVIRTHYDKFDFSVVARLLHFTFIFEFLLHIELSIQLFYFLCFRLNFFPEGNIHVPWLMAKMGFCSSKNLTDVLQVMPSYYQLKRTMRKRHSENTKKTWDPDTSSFFDPRQPKFSKYVNCYLNTTYSGLEWVYIRNQGSRNLQTLTFFVFVQIYNYYVVTMMSSCLRRSI